MPVGASIGRSNQFELQTPLGSSHISWWFPVSLENPEHLGKGGPMCTKTAAMATAGQQGLETHAGDWQSEYLHVM
jgi:hypothetical protein